MKQIFGILSLLVLICVLFLTPALAQESVQCEVEYTIQAGDWLSKIAEKYLGDPLAYPELVEPAGSQSATGDSILDIVWQWTELTGTAVNPPQTVPNPENYTITFKADGTYSGKADCNRIGGTYSTENGGLILSPEMITTMAACGPQSLEQDYVRLLGSVVAGGPDGAGGLALESAGGAERMVVQNGGPVAQ